MRLEDKSVIICGIVRNAEKGLRKNIPVIDTISKLFKSTYIVIYENDSNDKTKDILKEWQDSNPSKVFVSLNDIDNSNTIPECHETTANPFFSKKRIAKMANLRNFYMEYIDEMRWNVDFLLVVDLDVAELSVDGIISSFKSDRDWDAVIANGYSLSPKLHRRYHDTYALTLWEEQNQPQTEAKIIQFADRFGKLKKTDDWVRVASGFGGLAIYRFEAIKGLKYQVLNNDDTRVEVKCEHYSIYKQMMDRGYDRFYINPAMELKYQDLTFGIAWKSLKRRIKDVIKKMNKNI